MVFTLLNMVLLWASVAGVPRGQQEIPGRLGIYTYVWPLIPALTTVFLPLVSMRSDGARDRAAPAFARRRAADLAGFTALGLCAVAWRQDLSALVLVRNLALFVGLTALCIRLLGPTAAWMLPACLVMVTWLLGTDVHGEPRGWAVLLHASGSVSAAAVTAVVTVAGSVAYVNERARD